MGQKLHKPEEIVAKLRQVEVLTGQGRSIAKNPAQLDCQCRHTKRLNSLPFDPGGLSQR
jgi:hypothetical protein